MIQVVPGSHFFTKIEQIISYVELNIGQGKTLTHLTTGLRNTVKNGYNIHKELHPSKTLYNKDKDMYLDIHASLQTDELEWTHRPINLMGEKTTIEGLNKMYKHSEYAWLRDAINVCELKTVNLTIV